MGVVLRSILLIAVLLAAGAGLLSVFEQDTESPTIGGGVKIAVPSGSLLSAGSGATDSAVSASVTPSAVSSAPVDPWARERTNFRNSTNLATTIQAALAQPSAAGLFYAKDAVLRCGLMEGFSIEKTRAGDKALLAALEQCRDVPTNIMQFQSQYRSARLDPDQRRILDAADGEGDFKTASVRTRFEAVSITGDPQLAEKVARTWLAEKSPRLDGVSVAEKRTELGSAWALAVCEETNSCEQTVGNIRLCQFHGACSGDIYDRLQKAYSPAQIADIRAYSIRIRSALRAGEYSSFE